MDITYCTYIPATGEIFEGKDVESMSKRSKIPLIGKVPSMTPGIVGNNIRSTFLELNEWQLTNQTMCDQTTMNDFGVSSLMLPRLLEIATYPSLHHAFLEVPLIHTGSKHLLSDNLRWTDPSDSDGTISKAKDEFYAVFNAKKYFIYMSRNIGLKEIINARDIQHELDAFEALDNIEQEIQLNGVDKRMNDKTVAAKLNEIIRDTRIEYGSRITHMIMGAHMYRRYLGDSNICGSSVPGLSTGTPGIGPLPGLEYVTVIISPMMDIKNKDVIYAVDKRNGAFYGQGPMVLDSHSFGGANITEYYQYMIVDNNIKHEYGDDVKRRTALRINIP